MAEIEKTPDAFEGIDPELLGETSSTETTVVATETTTTDEFNDLQTQTQEPAATQTQTREPVVDTQTQTQTTQTDTTQAPAFKLSDIFGEDIDQETARTRYQEALEKSQRLEALVETQQKAISSSPAAKYDAFIKETGIEDYSVFQKLSGIDLDSTEVDPIEILVTRRVLDKKGKMSTEEQATYRSMLQRKYKQDVSQFTEEEIQEGKFMLEDDVESAKSVIQKVVSTINSSTPANPQNQTEELTSAWQPAVAAMVTDASASKLNFSIKGEEGSLKLGDEEVEIPVVFEFPKDQVEKAYAHAMRMIIQSGEKPTAEKQAQVRSYVTATLEQANNRKIYAKVAQLAIEKANEYWSKQTHNPSALKTGDAKINNQQVERTDEELAFEAEMGRG